MTHSRASSSRVGPVGWLLSDPVLYRRMVGTRAWSVTRFRAWLAAHYPDRADKVMHIVQDIRGGRDNDPEYFSRMKGRGVWAQLIRTRVKRAAREHGLDKSFPPIRSDLFRPPERDGQMALF